MCNPMFQFKISNKYQLIINIFFKQLLKIYCLINLCILNDIMSLRTKLYNIKLIIILLLTI